MMIYNLDAHIAKLRWEVEAREGAALRIEERAARRRLQRAPFLKTDLDRIRAKRRDYAAVHRAKQARLLAAAYREELARLLAAGEPQKVTAAAAAFSSLI